MAKTFKQQLNEIHNMFLRLEEKQHSSKYSKTIEYIDEAKSFTGAFKIKHLNEILEPNNSKVLFKEAIDFEFGDNEKGGLIVLSTDINAVKMDDNMFINWFKQKLLTIRNRFSYSKKIDQIAVKHQLAGWTIRKLLSGHYTDKRGNVYGENSVSVEILGVSDDTLIKIAEEVCNVFQQEAVLVRLYNTNRILFVNGN